MHCKSLWIKASAKCINVNVLSSLLFLPLFLPFPTFFCIAYKCLPLFSLSQYCCHFLITFSFITDFISFILCGISISTISSSTACLANLSASSFPLIPTWAGTHINCTSILLYFNSKRFWRISMIKSGLDSDFWLSILTIAEYESEHMTAFCIFLSLFSCTASRIAISSPVYTDSWSLILAFFFTSNFGTLTATPILPPFLEASVFIRILSPYISLKYSFALITSFTLSYLQ